MDELGHRSITPVMLALSLLLVSPLSGIPGVPTVFGIILIILAYQALFGRDRLWLPRRLRDRAVSSERLCRAIGWVRKPARLIDRVSRPRLLVLTVGPFRSFTFVVCAATAVIFPPLELLPMVTSFGAGAIALMAFGLLARDGLFILAGYVVSGSIYSIALMAGTAAAQAL